MRIRALDDAVEACGPNAANLYSSGAFFDAEEDLAGNTPLSYESALASTAATSPPAYVLDPRQIRLRDRNRTGYDKQSLKLKVEQSIGSSVLGVAPL